MKNGKQCILFNLALAHLNVFNWNKALTTIEVKETGAQENVTQKTRLKARLQSIEESIPSKSAEVFQLANDAIVNFGNKRLAFIMKFDYSQKVLFKPFKASLMVI